MEMLIMPGHYGNTQAAKKTAAKKRAMSKNLKTGSAKKLMAKNPKLSIGVAKAISKNMRKKK
jgi:hypothetical protein